MTPKEGYVLLRSASKRGNELPQWVDLTEEVRRVYGAAFTLGFHLGYRQGAEDMRNAVIGELFCISSEAPMQHARQADVTYGRVVVRICALPLPEMKAP